MTTPLMRSYRDRDIGTRIGWCPKCAGQVTEARGVHEHTTTFTYACTVTGCGWTLTERLTDAPEGMWQCEWCEAAYLDIGDDAVYDHLIDNHADALVVFYLDSR